VLLELGSDVMVRDQKGRTPLHRVAAGGGVGRGQVIRDLVKAGALVDVIDSENRTPMQLALLALSPEAIEALLEVGADPDYGISETVATPRVLAGTLLADPKFKGIRDDQRRALQAVVTAAPREQPKDRPR
jgi:ankyrin repeat protein